MSSPTRSASPTSTRSLTGAADGAASWAIRPPHDLVSVPDIADSPLAAADAAAVSPDDEVA